MSIQLRVQDPVLRVAMVDDVRCLRTSASVDGRAARSAVTGIAADQIEVEVRRAA